MKTKGKKSKPARVQATVVATLVELWDGDLAFDYEWRLGTADLGIFARHPNADMFDLIVDLRDLITGALTKEMLAHLAPRARRRA